MKTEILPVRRHPFTDARGMVYSANWLSALGPEVGMADRIPHRHEFYIIYWITSGQATHLIENQPLEVESGDLFFIAPGQVHQAIENEHSEGYIIAFNDALIALSGDGSMSPFLERFFENCTDNPVIRTNSAGTVILQPVIHKMIRETNVKDVYSPAAFLAALTSFLIECARLHETQGNKNRRPQFERMSSVPKEFKKLVDERYKLIKNVSDYAELLFVKPTLLNDMTKLAFGITAGEFIRNRILLEAKRLLLNTDLTAKEIAFDLGFDDSHYFSRFFKKYTGSSILEFRK